MVVSIQVPCYYKAMRRILLLMWALTLLASCGHGKARAGIPSTKNSQTAKVSASDLEGIASYYAEPYNGRRTASGEIFDSYNAMTAAHKTLPFNTVVRVKNLNNGEEVDVRINDRGPFVKGRVIDLSQLAAKQIDLVRAGIAPVKLKVLKDGSPTTKPPVLSPAPTPIPVPASAPPLPVPVPAAPSPDSSATPPLALTEAEPLKELPVYGVQVGAFQSEATANALRDGLATRYSDVSIQMVMTDHALFRVRVGRVSDIAAAEQLATQLRSEHFDTFIVRLN
jgi:rare lipoprotein A